MFYGRVIVKQSKGLELKNRCFSINVNQLFKKVKEVQLEIGFIEEMKTIWSNKKVLQTFFHNPLYSQKCDLICLTPAYH